MCKSAAVVWSVNNTGFNTSSQSVYWVPSDPIPLLSFPEFLVAHIGSIWGQRLVWLQEFLALMTKVYLMQICHNMADTISTSWGRYQHWHKYRLDPYFVSRQVCEPGNTDHQKHKCFQIFGWLSSRTWRTYIHISSCATISKSSELPHIHHQICEPQPDALTPAAGWLSAEVAGVVLFHLQTLAGGD